MQRKDCIWVTKTHLAQRGKGQGLNREWGGNDPDASHNHLTKRKTPTKKHNYQVKAGNNKMKYRQDNGDFLRQVSANTKLLFKFSRRRWSQVTRIVTSQGDSDGDFIPRPGLASMWNCLPERPAGVKVTSISPWHRTALNIISVSYQTNIGPIPDTRNMYTYSLHCHRYHKISTTLWQHALYSSWLKGGQWGLYII